MIDRVILTGATGFIGRSVCRRVATLGDTHLVVRPGSRVQGLDELIGRGVRVHCVDLMDPQQVDRCFRAIRPTHLLHLAWHGDPSTRLRSAANLDWTAATLRIARSFADSGGTRIVASGSCAEYDWDATQFVEDDTPLTPRSLYGRAKLATHQLITAAATELGLSVGWARIFFCYGPGEPPGRLVSDVLGGLLRQERVSCTLGTQVRDYMHCSDIGRALASFLASDFDGPLNIASGVGIAVRDLALRIATLLGRPDLLDFGSKPATPGEPPWIVADTTRLKRILAFEPIYTLDEGLADTIEWFRQRQAETPERQR